MLVCIRGVECIIGDKRIRTEASHWFVVVTAETGFVGWLVCFWILGAYMNGDNRFDGLSVLAQRHCTTPRGAVICYHHWEARSIGSECTQLIRFNCLLLFDLIAIAYYSLISFHCSLNPAFPSALSNTQNANHQVKLVRLQGDAAPISMARPRLHLRRRLSKLYKLCNEYRKERADARKKGKSGSVEVDGYEGYIPLTKSNLYGGR